MTTSTQEIYDQNAGLAPKPFEEYSYMGSLFKAIRENIRYYMGPTQNDRNYLGPFMKGFKVLSWVLPPPSSSLY